MLTDLSPQHIAQMMDIRARPCYYADQIFGIKTEFDDPWGGHHVYENQKRLIETPFRIRSTSKGKTAIGSGHMTGKTEAVKVLTCLWILSHYPAYVIILGDTQPAIERKIFPGIKGRIMSANKRIQSLFKGNLPDATLRAINYFDPKLLPTAQKWELDPEYGAYGFSPDMPEPLQGYHSSGTYGGTLFLADEANATPLEFLPSIKVYSKNPRNYVMLFGNPTSQDSPLSCIIRKEAGFQDWETFSISSWDTPNAMVTRMAIDRGELTDEAACDGDELFVEGFEGLATYSFCREYQSQHPNIYNPRVLGIPPDQSDDTWISRATITACGERGKKIEGICRREMLLVDPSWSRQGDDSVLLGVDPDRDCLTYREACKGKDETDLLGRIIALCLERPTVYEVRIEGDGIGAPLGHRLTRLLEGDGTETDTELNALRRRLAERGRIPHVEIIQSGGPAHDAVANANRKAENWRAMKAGLEMFAIPPADLDHFYEISKVKYLEPPSGKLQMEAKRDFKKRGNPSPGHADALALYYARPVGDPLFGAIQRHKKDLQMTAQPDVMMAEEREAALYFKAWGPASYSRPGKIARAWWYSRRTESAVVWVHVDQGDNWTVVDAMTFKDVHLEEITRRVFERSFDAAGTPHSYVADICGATEANAKIGAEDWYSDVIWAAMRKCAATKRVDGISSPMPQPMAMLAGTAGLDVLDRKIANHGKADRDVLSIWPSNAVRDMETARFRNPSANADPDADAPEDAHGGGGAIVRCLRLLAVWGLRG